MTREHMILAAIAAGVALGQPNVQAQSLLPGVEARLQAAADQGPQALRQFVIRTRMIYALSLADEQSRVHSDITGDAILSTDAAGDGNELDQAAIDRATADFLRAFTAQSGG